MWLEVAVQLCGMLGKVSGGGIGNWKYRLPITTISFEETFATNSSKICSVQLCIERWAKDMFIREKNKAC